MNSDVYKDAFKRFLADGMTHLEAMNQFDSKLFTEALLSEIESGYNKEDSLLDLLAIASRMESDLKDFEEQALPLYAAGWTSELPNPEYEDKSCIWSTCAVMSLYWRAPSKRLGKPGRKYLSTNQAFNAMKKTQPDPK